MTENITKEMLKVLSTLLIKMANLRDLPFNQVENMIN